MSSIPKVQRAVVVLEKGTTTIVDDKPVPEIKPGEILVKVKAVSLNPTDWKHIEWLLKPRDSTGTDFAGEIVQIGNEATAQGLKVGDSVAGIVRGGYNHSDNGAFQEYVKTYPALVWKKPASLSYEDAAPMGGVGLSTAAYALYYSLGVPKPWESKSAPSSILIWAGSTSVGLFAIALAKLAGIPIVSTASPHNFDLLKKLGADAVFDYKDPDVVSKIKEWGTQHGGIPIALDNISEHGSTKLVAQSINSDGKVVTLLKVAKDGEGWPADVFIDYILLYGAFEVSSDYYNNLKEWNSHLPELIEAGKVKNVNPIKVDNRGLDGIGEGLILHKSGKLSAQKLAYTFN